MCVFKGFALCDNKNISIIVNYTLICHVLHNRINKYIITGLELQFCDHSLATKV